MNLREIVKELRLSLKPLRARNMEILLFQSALLCFAKFKKLNVDRKNLKLEHPFTKIYETVEPIWALMENENDEALVTIIEEMMSTSDTDYIGTFEDLLLDAAQGFGHEFISLQPQGLTEVVAAICDYKGGSIYNPFAGVASYGKFFKAGQNYYGEEIEPEVWCLGLIRLLMSGGEAYSDNYVTGDSLLPRTEQFDYIVCTPPYGPIGRGIREEFAERLINNALYDKGNLTDNGTFIFVVNGAVAISLRYEHYRKFLSDNNYLDAVITLPDNTLFNTSIPLYIIKLRKGRKEDEPIRMLDASTYFNEQAYVRNKKVVNVAELLNAYNNPDNCILIQKSDVIAAGYQWAPALYSPKEEPKDGIPRVSLSNIVIPISPEKVEAESTQIINYTYLSSDPLNIDIEPIQSSAKTETQQCCVLRSPAMLIMATRNSEIKIGYVKASELNPAYYQRNLIAFSIDEDKVYQRYLALELTRAKIPDYGASYVRFSWKEMRDIQIPDLPLKEQIAAVKNYVSERPEAGYVSKTLSEKTYNALLCGEIGSKDFEKNKISISGRSQDLENLDKLVNGSDGLYDVIVVNDNNIPVSKIFNLLDRQVPVFIVSTRKEKLKGIVAGEDEVTHKLESRLFAPGDELSMLKAIRQTLDVMSTPESLLKNQYKEELDAARIIDETFRFETSVHKLFLSFILSRCKQGTRIVAEKSFDEIRKVRDCLIGEFQKVNILPAEMSGGAAADFLAKRTYKASAGKGTYYYLYKCPMPYTIAQGLQMITTVANSAIHYTTPDGNIGIALFHFLCSFAVHVKKMIENGVFKEPRQKREYWGIERHVLEEFRTGGPALAVGCLKRGGQDYFYCENTHVIKLKNREPRTGMKINILEIDFEKEPFIDDDGHKVYFLAKNWEIVSE
ncbi:MAG: SAM-dependent methyltransferase [Bacteroidales bacterium]|nr:SAM-dependent methyltransferase [Bacteroidales bacterium]